MRKELKEKFIGVNENMFLGLVIFFRDVELGIIFRYSVVI